MNGISEVQRLGDAVAALAVSLAEKLRAADRNQERDILGRAMGPVTKAEAAGNYPNRYVPIPPNGKRCEFTGLQHAKLYHLLISLFELTPSTWTF
jgi:hypothetical protein